LVTASALPFHGAYLGRPSAVRLDPVARPAWDHRRRDDRAAVSHLSQLPIQTISSGAGFIAEVQPSVTLLKANNQATNRCWICVDLPEEPDLSLPAILGDRHSVPRLGDIQSNENFAILLHGSSSCA